NILIICSIVIVVILIYIISNLSTYIERRKKWLAETWNVPYNITFTYKLYIPKAILPTPYPNQYDIITTTPNAQVTLNGTIVPSPSSMVSVREAIMNTTCILDKDVLDILEKQFLKKAELNGWKNFKIGQSYPITFQIPRRIALKPKYLKIIINLPDYRLQIYQIYKNKYYLIKSYSCIIGHPLFPTPLGNTKTNTLYWNPVWIPPKSEWAEKYEKLEPGGINPLGKAGMDFFHVYMIHGTEYPTRQAISHGCVRLANEDITELIWYLQNQTGHPCSLAQRIRHMHYLEEKRTYLPWGIAIELVYNPFLIKDENFIVLKDIYEKESFYNLKYAKNILSKYIPYQEIYQEKLEKVIAEGKLSGAKIPLAHLRKPKSHPPILGPYVSEKEERFLFFSWKAEAKTTADALKICKETFWLVTGNFEPGTMAVNLDAVLASANNVQRPF
ncbi:MAG: L,D-transpeptidase, partial [Candidatus Margulisbacteria bacterium]|nr:L,D-transpeptidase [Candidatus Margulisiibacteriota bacterium]